MAEQRIPGQDLPIEWKDTVVEAMTALWTKIAEFVPNLLGALIIVVIGYFVSKLLARLTTTVLQKLKFETASKKIGLNDTLSRVGISTTASDIVGTLVFWLFMLTFLISGSETLGLENVSQTIDTFVSYMPQVIAAAMITVLGLMLAHFVRSVVETALEGMGLSYARSVSRLAHTVLLVVVSILAIDQLGIDTGILSNVIEIVLIAAGTALAIALGLGTRGVANGVVSGVYARDNFRVGAQIEIDQKTGTIESVGAITTIITSKDGTRVHIPNTRLVQAIVVESPAKPVKPVKTQRKA